jgi:hypothetical protein
MTRVIDMTEERRATARGWAENRRRDLAAKKLCINGESHGPATQGCRCNWCAAVHKKGLRKVLADPAAPPRPPGYKVPEIYKPFDIAAVPDSAGGDVSQVG